MFDGDIYFTFFVFDIFLDNPQVKRMVWGNLGNASSIDLLF